MRIPEAAKASHMNQKIENFIIVGVTREGKKFRPSDWSDRLCGVMSAFGADHRMTYSPYVRPGCTLKGDKTVLVDGAEGGHHAAQAVCPVAWTEFLPLLRDPDNDEVFNLLVHV